MTKEQQAAMAQLAAAFGVPQQKPAIPKSLAGKVLAEITSSLAGEVQVRDSNGKLDFKITQGAGTHADPSMLLPGKSTPPKDSALAELTAYLAGTDLADQPSTGNVTANPLAAMQALVERMERRLDEAIAAGATKTTNTDDDGEE